MKKVKILLVDNNKVILKLLTYLLEKMGHEVRVAEDGLSALEILESYLPDIMFIDLIMPNITGDLLCSIIRKRKEFDSIFLAILSAVATEEQIDYISFGANACIAKGTAKDMEKHISQVLVHAEMEGNTPFTGKILGAQDIYKREITKELLAKKKHFEITLENMGSGFLELSWSGKIIFANSTAATLFNTSDEELLSSNFIDYFEGEDRNYIERYLDKLQRTPIELGEEFPISLNSKYISIKIVPSIGHEQKSIIIILNDITQRKLTEQKLHQYMSQLEEMVTERTEAYEQINKKLEQKISERIKINDELEFVARQWSNTFDTIPDFISIHDKDMKFVRVNKALATFLGKDPEEILGTTCYEMMHNRSSPWPNCPHLTAFEKHEVVTEEIDDPHIGFPLLVTCSPLFHDDGSILGTVHVARDISRQKQLEEREQQLIIEHEQFKRVESLRTMAGAIAHRFNNAMMAVQGNLDLITQSLPDNSDEHKMATDAALVAREASQVGSTMLNYVCHRSLQLEELLLTDFIKENLTRIKNQFHPSITITYTHPAQSLYCSMDQKRIQEVIDSILTNSVESLGDDHGTIEVTCGSAYFEAHSFPISFQDDKLTDGEYVFCQIKDSGHGISAENLPRIFEPFFTTRFIGRGLGLPLTVGIMKSHHGAITVESTEGSGTSVRILFPASPQQPAIPDALRVFSAS